MCRHMLLYWGAAAMAASGKMSVSDSVVGSKGYLKLLQASLAVIPLLAQLLHQALQVAVLGAALQCPALARSFTCCYQGLHRQP